MHHLSMESQEQSICRLCKQKSKLLRSHIIPKFVYKPCIDENNKNRFWVLSMHPEKSGRYEQRQITERMLCNSCESLIGKFETYASKLFNVQTKVPPYREGMFVVIPEVNYTKIRLFYLSILWRMSVSKHSFFDSVSLGKHEDILRKILLSGKAPPPEKYSFFCAIPLVEDTFHADWILQPQRITYKNQTAYRVLLNGILVVFMVSCAPALASIRPLILQEDGMWTFICKPVEEIEYIKNWIVASQITP